jgi:tetratricopeptide (TPR) repeat protein
MQEGTPIQNAPIEAKQSPKLSQFLGRVIDSCIMGLALLMPLWFLPFTLDILELNKQTLLVAFTMVALLAWVGKALLDRSFSLTRSWLHLVVGFFLVGYLITSLFSLDRYISFVGNIGQMQWAFVTIASFVVLYFIIVNRFRTTGRVYDVLLWFMLGSALTGLYGLFQILGFHIFGSGNIAAARSFNTVGTVNALGAFMVIPTVIATALTVLGCDERGCYLGSRKRTSLFWRIVVFATLGLGLLTAIIIDFWVIWAALIFGIVVILAIQFFSQGKACKRIILAIPVGMIVISIFLLLFKTPIDLEIPAEVSPSAGHTWQIAQQVLRDAPLFGSGPGTWLYDYAKYRSIGVNVSQFWTIRFERGLTAFLTMLGMIGLVGTTLWLMLIGSGIAKSVTHLIRRRDCDEWLAYLTVFAGWITTVFLAFLYNYNVTHHFAFWMLLALLGVLVTQGKVTWDQRSKKWVSGLLSIVLILLAVGAISATWLMGQRIVADAQYSSAVKSFQKGDSIDTSIDYLKSAVSLNKMNDVYYRNLSQAYLVKVSRMMQAEPSEELVKQVNAHVAEAVETARKAIEINPASVDNYSNLAIVYQAIASFTRGADEFAIRNYEEALALEPNNPVFMNEIGKLYVLRSDAYRTLLDSPDAAAKAEAEGNVKVELEQAAEWFNKAITTKPDYAAAHFNLGLVYEREGRLDDSIRKFEEVLRVNPQDIGVAFQLAILYYRNGNKVASKSMFEQIIQAEPQYANARWFLASLYEEEGLLDLAITEVLAVQETNPDNMDVAARLEALYAKKAAGNVPTEEIPIPEPLEEGISSPGIQNPIQP